MLKSNWCKSVCLASTLLAGAMAATMAQAAENGPLNYPAGSPGILVGEFPPIPGLFMVSQLSYTSADGFYDENGDEIKGDDFEMDVWVETLRFVASYPGKLMGANIYSQLVVPLVKIEASLTVDTPFGPYEVFDDDDSGLGNITVSPLILNWQKPESHQYFTVGLDVALESGASYDKDSEVNAGTGYTSVIPVVAYRYDDPEGLDIGVKANFMFNLENDSTGYDSGDMLAIDFTAGWNIGKWKVGVVGGYTDQWENDEQDGVEVKNSELKTMTIGPSIAYSSGPLIVNINYQKGVIAENSSESDSFWINFTLPLYVPNPPMPE